MGAQRLFKEVLINAIVHNDFLRVQVVEAENSEDFEDASPFTAADAEREQKLSMSIYEMGYDWLEALLIEKGHDESLEFTRKFLNVRQNELCMKRLMR